MHAAALHDDIRGIHGAFGRSGVNARQPRGAELDAAEIPHDDAEDIFEAVPFQNGKNRTAGRP